MLKYLFVAMMTIISTAAVSQAQWVRQNVNTNASFRGLSVVSKKVVWASGTGGTVIRTADGGETWNVIAVPGASDADFRDIEAFDANTAYILSIGSGAASRILKTSDGGRSWDVQFVNDNEKAFFDAIGCWDKNNCIAMSDPVDNFYHLISTSDGGKSWKFIDTERMDNAKPGEAAFAASGTCLITRGKMDVYLVTGGSDARVFHSKDRGWTWTVADTPMPKGTPGSGIFSIAFRNSQHGTIVGGNYEKPAEAANNLAFTSDGGKTWYDGEGLSGYRSAVAYIDDRTLIAVGTNGTDVSSDRGRTWKKIGTENLNAVQSKGKDAIWAAGPKGGIYKLNKF